MIMAPINTIRLEYIGKQENPGKASYRLWTINSPGHRFHHSTRSLEGLLELGIVPPKFVKLIRMGRT